MAVVVLVLFPGPIELWEVEEGESESEETGGDSPGERGLVDMGEECERAVTFTGEVLADGGGEERRMGEPRKDLVGCLARGRGLVVVFVEREEGDGAGEVGGATVGGESESWFRPRLMVSALPRPAWPPASASSSSSEDDESESSSCDDPRPRSNSLTVRLEEAAPGRELVADD